MDKITLDSGVDIPSLAVGTSFGSHDDVIGGIVKAIEAGYRHIDICQVDGHAALIGEGLKRVLDKKIVKREDLFISVKLWNSYIDPFHVEKGLDLMLKDLNLRYVDMLMPHFPTAFKYQELKPHYGTDKERLLTIPLADTWEAFEQMHRLGKAKDLGLANFNKQQILSILQECQVKPSILHIESSVIFPNQDLIDFCKTQNITCFTYLPFGHPDHEMSKKIFETPSVINVAKNMSKTPAQVCLKYCIQRDIGIVVDVREANRLEEYKEIFDFNIDIDEMFQISNGINPVRTAKYEFLADHVKYPFV